MTQLPQTLPSPLPEQPGKSGPLTLGRMPIDGPETLVRLRNRVLQLCRAAGCGVVHATRVATGCSEVSRAALDRQPSFVFEAELVVDAPQVLRFSFQGVNYVPELAGAGGDFFDRLDVRAAAGRDAWLVAEARCPAGTAPAVLLEEAARIFTLTPADRMLRVILPDSVAEELTTRNEVATRRHENVAVLFADVVGFTRFCDGREPDEVVEHLQDFSRTFEVIAARHRVEKIKTIGDCFMAAAGIPEPIDGPVNAAVRCGLEMIGAAKRLASGWELRMGVHVGPVIAGVVGIKRFSYDLWGDTVNTASRVESNGQVGCVNLSQAAWFACRDEFNADSIGRLELKGKGAMELFAVRPEPDPTAD